MARCRFGVSDLAGHTAPDSNLSNLTYVLTQSLGSPVDTAHLPACEQADDGLMAALVDCNEAVAGTFTNPALVAALRSNPDGYYVNVHTSTCPPGAIRGQLGDHGPGNQ